MFPRKEGDNTTVIFLHPPKFRLATGDNKATSERQLHRTSAIPH